MSIPTQARLMRAVAASTMVLAAACTSEQPAESTLAGARLELRPEVDPNALILIDPHAATLSVGHGIIYQARIVDEHGQTIAGARPTWRSTNTSVARVTALPDSAGVEATRAAVGGMAIGSALVIASYNGLADTSRITVVAVVDTAHTTPPGGGTTPVRPLTFDATIVVRGFVSGVDSATAGTQLVPGATITLTRLPSILGDSLPTGVTSVTTPTVVGTQTADASSQVVFRGVPQSRLRITVTPPAGTSWQPASVETGPPQVASYSRLITLRTP